MYYTPRNCPVLENSLSKYMHFPMMIYPPKHIMEQGEWDLI